MWFNKNHAEREWGGGLELEEGVSTSLTLLVGLKQGIREDMEFTVPVFIHAQRGIFTYLN